MASTKDMTETDLLHADQIFENTVGLIEDIIANPSALEHVPSPSTIEIIPIADAIDDDQVIARTARFAIKVVATSE